jgi:hypothetical protein
VWNFIFYKSVKVAVLLSRDVIISAVAVLASPTAAAMGCAVDSLAI